MADAETQVRFSELFALAQERHMPYPLVLIDGQLRMTGSVHYYQLLPLVERALQQVPE